ncbi:MAG: DUF4446 family protein [Selenomonadaceae bacterium]|nr:DUF4446 family protein [Selenomonadaceae bacterium]
MENMDIMNYVVNNTSYMIAILGVLMIVMYLLIINLYYNLNYMKKRYKKMMTGIDDGANLERMLLGHIDETRSVAQENEKLKAENKRIDDLLKRALTRVSVVRFRAFEDMGSDLSYSVALLDSHNNGVVMSSIFGREDSRSYVKPIENGTSTYQLTAEEEQALREAMSK